MKKYGRVEVQPTHPRYETERPGPFTSRKDPRYPLDRGLGEPQNRSRRGDVEKNPLSLTEVEPRSSSPYMKSRVQIVRVTKDYKNKEECMLKWHGMEETTPESQVWIGG
jgi:hypothetical protein